MMLTGLKAQATEYVTDVMVIGAYSSSEVSSLASTYQAQGWKLIDYDLNKGCGYSSHDIYLLYKTGTNVEEAITDLMDFGDGETTGMISIHNSQFTIHNEADTWYSLDGRRLNGKPSMKGVYVNNERKVIIK